MKVRTAFGVTVSGAKAETMCLHGKNTPMVEFSVYAAGEVYKRTKSLFIVGEPSQTLPTSTVFAERVQRARG